MFSIVVYSCLVNCCHLEASCISYVKCDMVCPVIFTLVFQHLVVGLLDWIVSILIQHAFQIEQLLLFNFILNGKNAKVQEKCSSRSGFWYLQDSFEIMKLGFKQTLNVSFSQTGPSFRIIN